MCGVWYVRVVFECTVCSLCVSGVCGVCGCGVMCSVYVY